MARGKAGRKGRAGKVSLASPSASTVAGSGSGSGAGAGAGAGRVTRLALPVVPSRGDEPSSPHEPRFSCRECPARCCRLPWSIRLTEQDRARYLAEPFVVERAGPPGLAVIERGVLPSRERDGRLECVFLDDDERCSLHKRFGHAYLPRPCQAYPFGFVTDEHDVTLAQLSQLCPSIRDERGELVGEQLEPKLRERGGALRLTHRMATLSGTLVTREQVLRVAERWDTLLASAPSLAEGLHHALEWTHLVDQALGSGGERASDELFERALALADDRPSAPLEPRARSSWHTRLYLAYTLGNLAYPSRLRAPNRAGTGGALEGLRALGNKLAFMLERGSVDLLFIEPRVPLARVARVERVVRSAHAGLLRDYLRLALARRQLFTEPRHLLAPLLDLALAAVLASRFARCRAAAHGRASLEPLDVREGVGVAELLVLHHASLAHTAPHLASFRWQLLTKRASLTALLASEA
jgi:lysine-N-methylase